MRKYLSLIKESLRGEQNNFTTGSIKRAMALLAIPMMLEMAMESIFSLVDTYFVGKVSTEALTTIGLTEVSLTIIYSLGIGLSIAPMAMIARFIGEKEPQNAAKAARQAIWLAIGISMLIAVPGVVYAPDLLRLLGGSEKVVAEGATYTRIMYGSNAVIMILFLLNGVFRGAGEATKAMRVLWLANGINIVLDPMFIFGFGPIPAMGVTGAAIATTIGRSIGVGYQLYLLLGGRSVVNLSLGRWGIDMDMMRRLIRIASTGAFQYIIASASWIVLMRIVAETGGDATVAGYQVAIRLVIFTLLPAWGLANATATFVGQNLGAEQADRAEKGVWMSLKLITAYMLIVGVVYVLAAEPLVYAFAEAEAARQPGVLALRIFGFGYALFGAGMAFSNAFNGAGDTRTPTLLNFIAFWIIEMPLGYLFGIQFEWGLAGVCYALLIANGVLGILAYALFNTGKWKTVKV
ncbi:MAG: MATE family efflux transporter [Bacteroidota bacterium]